MATLVTTQTTAKDGRFALKEGSEIIGFGRLECQFVPPTNDGAILGVQFVLEPRTASRTNEEMMIEANS